MPATSSARSKGVVRSAHDLKSACVARMSKVCLQQVRQQTYMKSSPPPQTTLLATHCSNNDLHPEIGVGIPVVERRSSFAALDTQPVLQQPDGSKYVIPARRIELCITAPSENGIRIGRTSFPSVKGFRMNRSSKLNGVLLSHAEDRRYHP